MSEIMTASKNLHIGKQLITSLKEFTNYEEAHLCIPVGRPVHSILRPIPTNEHNLRNDDIKNLTEWRNKFGNAFLTEFVATETQTKDWLLTNVNNNPCKILFMLESLMGEAYGYMGLDCINWESSYGEADAIVKGVDAPKGCMAIALKTLLSWARAQIGLNRIGVRVLHDNNALLFYKKIGFEEYKRISLKKTVKKDKVQWIEQPSYKEATRFLVYMNYKN